MPFAIFLVPLIGECAVHYGWIGSHASSQVHGFKGVDIFQKLGRGRRCTAHAEQPGNA